jgi:hypothetical protein
MAKEIASYWSRDGQAYIIGEWAFVLTPDLRTVRVPKADLEKSGNGKIAIKKSGKQRRRRFTSEEILRSMRQRTTKQ